ncbi:MAG: zinc ribbon domain-containing protein [Phascolarctobacterium sp.]|nr:zinc ribbon domain-containing protein [Phascolarctobacterium sp.]
MRIEGAGACFDSRIYEIDADVAWNIIMLSINEMGVTVDDVDEKSRLIRFHNQKKLMQIAVQPVDDESVQIIMDSQRERLQIYTWKKETKEVNLFFELFDSKLREYRAFILCPSCKAKVSSMVKFCPECGEKLK